MNIYVVEDDLSIQKLIEYALKSKGYEFVGFEKGSEFFEKINMSLPDLVLLDIMLPDIDGISILEKLKKDAKTRYIPVMMLTAKDSEIDIVTALDKGADDYVKKPFSVLELLSRINALLRRSVKTKDEVLEYDGIKVDLPGRNVYVNDEIVNLTFKEYELLIYLMNNADIVLSRENLITSIWGYDFVGETRTIDMHIKSLREKLKDKSRYIKTIRGVGYKFSVGDESGA